MPHPSITSPTGKLRLLASVLHLGGCMNSITIRDTLRQSALILGATLVVALPARGQVLTAGLWLDACTSSQPEHRSFCISYAAGLAEGLRATKIVCGPAMKHGDIADAAAQYMRTAPAGQVSF